jgi:glycosyltransferase involved in cell wall biosynthesis
MHQRVVLLDNFPPLSLFGPPLERPEGRPTIAYVGSVSMIRGFATMVAMLEKVRERMSDARLIVYGSPTEEVAPLVADVERRLSKEAIEFRGHVSYGQLPDALRDAHVALSLQMPHVKHEKNPSMKVFDYMALGIPYVGSDFPPIREATREQGGLLVTPGDANAAAEAVLKILSDPDEARRLGAEGRAAVEERLSWEIVEGRMFSLYSELLGE